MNAETIDGFAGPGGWDEAARQLGLDPLGIEIDDAACATRRARGHRTLQADLTALDPLEFAPVRRMIFSPPCPSFSMAGKGEGRSAIPLYQEAMVRMAVECKSVDRAELDEVCGDPRAHLILEPLRWALALRPEWVACEQVELCLPLWETMAGCLRHVGYMTWTGVLSAECFGVPQTRRRAFLLASLSRQPERPAPTHQRYVPPRVKPRQEESLFDPPEPERIVLAEDRTLEPWVSMAEALGWAGATYLNGTHEHRAERPMSEPAPAVMFGARLNTVAWQPADQVGFPRRNDQDDGGEYRERDFRSASEPAFTVTEKARSAVRMRANAQENAAVRSADEPAPTITGGHDTGDRVWVTDTGNTRSGSRESGRNRRGDEPAPAITSRADQLERRPGDPPTHYDSRGQRDGRTREPNRQRRVDEPAPTIAGESRNDSWVAERPATTICGSNPGVMSPEGGGADVSMSERGYIPWVRARDDREDEPRDPDWPSKRPATTVAGDPRVFPPGHKLNDEDVQAGRVAQHRSGAGSSNGLAEPDGPGAVRVSIEEASVLQGFPPDYPWQGSRTAIYRQIGDAVPPPLARAVLAELER